MSVTRTICLDGRHLQTPEELKAACCYLAEEFTRLKVAARALYDAVDPLAGSNDTVFSAWCDLGVLVDPLPFTDAPDWGTPCRT